MSSPEREVGVLEVSRPRRLFPIDDCLKFRLRTPWLIVEQSARSRTINNVRMLQSLRFFVEAAIIVRRTMIALCSIDKDCRNDNPFLCISLSALSERQCIRCIGLSTLSERQCVPLYRFVDIVGTTMSIGFERIR